MNYREHILVVDDDPALLEQTELILYERYQVSLAISGSQAISYLKRGQPVDLILLDILMPEMDGYQTMQEIRKLPGHQLTPVIFLTSLSGPEAELQCLDCGAADYITKPYDPRVLLARIARRLENGFQLDEKKLEQLAEPLSDVEWQVARLLNQQRKFCSHLYFSNTFKKGATRNF